MNCYGVRGMIMKSCPDIVTYMIWPSIHLWGSMIKYFHTSFPNLSIPTIWGLNGSGLMNASEGSFRVKVLSVSICNLFYRETVFSNKYFFSPLVLRNNVGLNQITSFTNNVINFLSSLMDFFLYFYQDFE